MNQRTPLVYGLLLAAWGVIAVWQTMEHRRVIESERRVFRNGAKEISRTLEIVIRSQRRFWGSRDFVPQEGLQLALNDLVSGGKLSSVGLLNADGEVVLSSGAPIEDRLQGISTTGERWGNKTVTVMNLIDFGANVAREGEVTRATILIAPPRRDPQATNTVSGVSSNMVSTGSEGRGRPPRRPPFGRPPGMSEEDYQQMIQKQTLHGFAIVLPIQSLTEAVQRDWWMRAIIVFFGGVAMLGFGMAWRNQTLSSELQMRLLRASELNTHLKEMNIAAAGLAHETRNPLNIIRGVAQMISHLNDASPEVREKSSIITDEVDRVTAQLNEFINYSRPREVRRAPVALNSVVSDVVRALDCDLEEKTIRLTVLGEELTVEADEQLLRQVLFNLLINSVQAVDIGGHIQITSKKSNSEAILEVSDNGPGVASEVRQEIFKPYFTTRKSGTGLGLAVVHQIVLAHGWAIECLTNSPHGAIFRISGMKLSRS